MKSIKKDPLSAFTLIVIGCKAYFKIKKYAILFLLIKRAMKNILVVISFLLLISCGDEERLSDIRGTWTLKELRFSDCLDQDNNTPILEAQPDDCVTSGQFKICHTIQFNANWTGTSRVTINDVVENVDFSYSLDNGIMTVIDENGKTMTWQTENYKVMIISSLNDCTMINTLAK